MNSQKRKVNIAIQGCCHGELDIIYDDIKSWEEKNGEKVHLLLLCGDSQCTRNDADLFCMAVRDKFRKVKDFPNYYFGRKVAPVLTILIGGNHEASNFFQELPYGGWVAPNMYYMGYCNSLLWNGLRITGISGIFKHYSYNYYHYEVPPYSESTKRSVYHTRSIDIFKMKLLKGFKVDFMMSHDWPHEIVHFGNMHELYKRKPLFKPDIETGRFGDPHKSSLLRKLQPTFWVAGHYHVHYMAYMKHVDNCNDSRKRPNFECGLRKQTIVSNLLYENSSGGETSTNMEKNVSGNETLGETKEPSTTFIGLDKPKPNRIYMKVLSLFHSCDDSCFETDQLCYDPVWLCILRNTFSLEDNTQRNFCPPETAAYIPTTKDIDEIKQTFGQNVVPRNFQVTVEESEKFKPNSSCDVIQNPNPQHEEFCKKFGLIKKQNNYLTAFSHNKNPDEINLD